jgi:hypothetical protein
MDEKNHTQKSTFHHFSWGDEEAKGGRPGWSGVVGQPYQNRRARSVFLPSVTNGRKVVFPDLTP